MLSLFSDFHLAGLTRRSARLMPLKLELGMMEFTELRNAGAKKEGK